MRDVIVIGGGPAGSTVACLLTKLGYDVLLLEKERFPRHHIGESTLPSSLGVLESIGVMDKIRAAGFPVKRGGVYVWGKTRKPWLFRFGELGFGSALQVERARFDQILLEHARTLGVDVREEHQVVEPIDEDGRVVGVNYINVSGERGSCRARWVVDASGQSALIAVRRRTRLTNDSLRNVAVYGYWRGPRAIEIQSLCAEATADDRNSIFIETTAAGWCWWIPIGEEHFSVGIVAGREAIKDLSGKDITAFYLERLKEAPLVSRIIGLAHREEPTRAIRDWSYRSTEFCGPGFVLTGDAAAFVDPILSTGIFLALNSATAATALIHTVSRGALPEGHCLDWYRHVYNAVYDDYEAMVQHWYFGERTQESWFWRARRILDSNKIADFRTSFVLLAAGASHDVFRALVNSEESGVTYLSNVGSMGCMGDTTPLRRVASALELDLPSELPELPQTGGIRLVLAPRNDWTLCYALVTPEGRSQPIPPEKASTVAAVIEEARATRR